MRRMLIFSPDPDCTPAAALAAELEQQIAAHEDLAFDDGEHGYRPKVDPRGADCYVVAGLHGGPIESPHDKLARLLLFAGALQEHGAGRITAVLPYLGWTRKDRRTRPFDSVPLRHVAAMLEAVGVAQVIALEAHNVAAFETAFRCPTLHVPAHAAFDTAVSELLGDAPIAVAAPDPGGVRRAQAWRDALAERLDRPVGFAMVERCSSAGLVSEESLVAGDVRGMSVLVLDDLVASGRTLRRAVHALHRAGSREVIACAAHGLFTGQAHEALADDALRHLMVTDSVPPFRVPASSALARRLKIASCAPGLARAVHECHVGWTARR